jgi:hypothetical protein
MRRGKRAPRELTLVNLLARNSPFSWRAFFAFVVTMTAATVLHCVGKLNEAHWVEITQWVAGFFMTGETVRKFARGSEDGADEHDGEDEKTDGGNIQ